MNTPLETKAGSSIFDGSYELLCTIGRGANSIIYKARPLNPKVIPDEFVAIKVLTDTAKDPEGAQERIRRESTALLKSASPNVIKLLDSVATPELCYLVLEYAPYGNLKELLQQYPHPLSPERSLKLTLQVLNGLEALHRAGILHRDIKPENLLVVDRSTIKITDFSIALLAAEHRGSSTENRAVGTLDYAAPEFLTSGEVSETSDLYAAAITCFEFLSKNLPFEGQTLSKQLNRKISGIRTTLGEFVDYETGDLEKLFERSLSPDRNRRFQNAREFRQTIEAILNAKQFMKKAGATSAAVRALTARTSGSSVALQLHGEISDLQRARGAQQLTKLRERRVRTKTQHIELAPFHKRTCQKTARPWRTVVLTASAVAIVLTLAFGFALFGSKESALASLAQPLKIQAGLPTRSFMEGVRDLMKQSETAYSKAKLLTRGTHIGTLKRLFTDDHDIALLTQGAKDRERFVIALGVPGWTPRTIVLSKRSTSNELQINGHGLQLSLWIDPKSSIDGRLEGNYRDHISGREGTWFINSNNDNHTSDNG